MKKMAIVLLGLLIFSSAIPSQALGATNVTPTPTATNPYGAAPLDPPGPTEVVLTVKKGTKVVTFTMRQLLKMKSATVTINEPFIKKRQKFGVIALSALFAKAGIKGNDKVSTKALNDYVYANTAAKFISAKGLLAIQRDGKNIPFDQGGPIRIIFPSDSIWASYLDPWNWSLMTISAK